MPIPGVVDGFESGSLGNCLDGSAQGSAAHHCPSQAWELWSDTKARVSAAASAGDGSSPLQRLINAVNVGRQVWRARLSTGELLALWPKPASHQRRRAYPCLPVAARDEGMPQQQRQQQQAAAGGQRPALVRCVMQQRARPGSTDYENRPWGLAGDGARRPS